MKLNKVIIGAAAIVAAVVLYSNRSVKADQRSIVRSSCVTFLAGQYGTNIVIYNLNTHGPAVPLGLNNYDSLAATIDACVDAGMIMREDGTFFIFTSTLGR